MDQVTPIAKDGDTPLEPGFRPRTAEELKAAVLGKLKYEVAKDPIARASATGFSRSRTRPATSSSRTGSTATNRTYREDRKRVYYLSLEFLIGRLLFDAMTNLGIVEPMTQAIGAARRRPQRAAAASNPTRRSATAASGGSPPASWTAWRRWRSPRTATAFATIMACSGRSSAAAGSRRFPRTGLRTAIPGNSSAPEVNYAIGFGGCVEAVPGDGDFMRHIWRPGETVEAVAYDTPIVGWSGRHVNTLRLWSARAPDPLKLDAFNAGDYVGALADQVRAEAISKVLYPSDATPAGQELRLRQEYFFASASLLDLVRRHVKQHRDVRTLGEHVAVQLNDTHPSIGVAELMRILVDMNRLNWEEAWEITQAVFSYTNHTLLPEALESWPVAADGAAAAAPHADHLSHQRRPSRQRARKRGLNDPACSPRSR